MWMEFILTYQLYPFYFFWWCFFFVAVKVAHGLVCSWDDLDENPLSLYLLVIFSLDILLHRSRMVVYGGWQFCFLQFGNKARKLQEACFLFYSPPSISYVLVLRLSFAKDQSKLTSYASALCCLVLKIFQVGCGSCFISFLCGIINALTQLPCSFLEA